MSDIIVTLPHSFPSVLAVKSNTPNIQPSNMKLDRKVPENRPWQIDVVCVYLNFEDRKARVEVLENVIL